MPGEKEKGIRTDRSGVGETAPTGINHLLVIAIDEYERCPALNNCVKDAKDFAQLLWERYQFEEGFTTFLFNKDATRSNILEKLAELEEKVQGQDSLLIYYSGHGETKENAGYWIPVNGRSEHLFRHEWVSTDELIRYLDAIDSFHTVVIADACFSGSLFAPLQRSGGLGNEQLKSRLGLAASHSRGKALDGTPGENSPFAERLLHNLKENKSALGFSRLATTVQEEVTKVTEGKQTPVFKPLNVKGDDSGQFVFKLRKDEEERLWAQALEGREVVSFQAYLEQYPNGSHSGTARQIMRELEEEGHWEKASSSDSLEILLDFLERYPNSRFKKSARDRIDYLEDMQDWQNACRTGKISDFLEYKDKHPNGRYLQESDRRIAELRGLLREADAWRKAQNEHSELGYRRYLDNFPAGPNAAKARAALDALEQNERAGANRSRDEAAWSSAKGRDEVIAYQEYLDGFPEGLYRKAASDRIESLEKARLLEASAAKDRTAWEKALQEHTIAAYREYIGLGYVMFKGEAEKAIAGLEALVAKEKDEAAWQDAVKKNTREGYVSYINAGHKLYKTEAEKRMAGHSAGSGKTEDRAGGGTNQGNHSSGAGKELKQLGIAAAAILLVIAMIWRPWEEGGKDIPPQVEDGKFSERVVPMESQAELLKKLDGNMVFVPGGTFTMGCTKEQGGDCYGDEKPSHQVTLSDYYIGKYEVTLNEFRIFIEATKYLTDAEKAGSSYVWNGSTWKEKVGVNWRHRVDGTQRPSSEGNHPVLHVSWNDAVEYCKWLSNKTGKTYRLPTEAEWEYAARGGSSSLGYKYSGSSSLAEVAWYDGNSGSKTHPVGQKKANELGLYDMSGNVWEWCADWYGDYSSGAQKNPKGPSRASGRVYRGGSWGHDAQYCRVSYRRSNTPSLRNSDLGFRLAL